MTQVEKQASLAKDAALALAEWTTEQKNALLLTMADGLVAASDAILAANARDVENARKNGMTSAYVERMTLSPARTKAMAAGLRDVARLPDPTGSIEHSYLRPNGLAILQKRVPLGVIGVIYESRPNVTADVAALCLKTGNAALLRGGSDAYATNSAIMDALLAAAKPLGLPEGALDILRDSSREAANQMMRMDGYIDALIPRGGKKLKQAIEKTATIPVIMTGEGNCHTYVDKCADIQMASDIALNAKISRPSTCNATETLLVHRDIAEAFLPVGLEAMKAHNVEVRGCERTKAIVPWVLEATEEDWATEFNDFILAVRVVDSLEEAIGHINRYGTKHSEAIITGDVLRALRFMNRVDAAAVYHNASTRFTDGGEFGLGAEIGISNQKLHARGPMGLEALTTTKFYVMGNGQVR